jgi:hypothetical protein
MFILIPLTNLSFKEGYGRDIFINKNRNNLVSSIIVCYSITFISLIITLALYEILRNLKIAWDVGVDDTVDAIFNSKIIYLCPFFIGIIPAFMEEFFRGFGMAFFKKIFKSTFVSILIIAFIWGFSHIATDGSFYPGYIIGIEKFLNGIIIGYILLYLGIEIAILWHFLNNFLATNIFLLYLGSNLVAYALFLSILILLPFFVATFLYFKKPAAVFSSSE